MSGLSSDLLVRSTGSILVSRENDIKIEDSSPLGRFLLTFSTSLRLEERGSSRGIERGIKNRSKVLRALD